MYVPPEVFAFSLCDRSVCVTCSLGRKFWIHLTLERDSHLFNKLHVSRVDFEAPCHDTILMSIAVLVRRDVE